MRQQIEAFADARRIAVVGVSRAGRSFGTYAARELTRRGRTVRPVHPTLDAVDGQPCAKRLSDLAGEVDAVLVAVPPDAAIGVLEDAAEIGVKNIWVQQGADAESVADAARDLGLEPIMGGCVLMHVPPVGSFHRVHRGLCRATGTLYSDGGAPAAAPGRREGAADDAGLTLSRRIIEVLLFALLVWAVCGMTMGLALTWLPETAALWLHAGVATLTAASAASIYAGRDGAFGALTTAGAFSGLALTLDLTVVAPSIMGSYAMFASVLGVWVPLIGIFAAAWLAVNVRRTR